MNNQILKNEHNEPQEPLKMADANSALALSRPTLHAHAAGGDDYIWTS